MIRWYAGCRLSMLRRSGLNGDARSHRREVGRYDRADPGNPPAPVTTHHPPHHRSLATYSPLTTTHSPLPTNHPPVTYYHSLTSHHQPPSLTHHPPPPPPTVTHHPPSLAHPTTAHSHPLTTHHHPLTTANQPSTCHILSLTHQPPPATITHSPPSTPSAHRHLPPLVTRPPPTAPPPTINRPPPTSPGGVRGQRGADGSAGDRAAP